MKKNYFYFAMCGILLLTTSCVPQKNDGKTKPVQKEKVEEDEHDLTDYQMVRQKTKSGKNIFVLIEK